MRIVGRVFRLSAFLANVLVAVGFLVCAYSSYISPTLHPRWACVGLAFPVFLVMNAFFCFFWLIVRRRYVFFPLAVFLLGGKALLTYCPMQIGQTEEAHSNSLKVLTYNIMGMRGQSEGGEEQFGPIVDYILASGADIVCLQEFPFHKKGSVQGAVRKIYPYMETIPFSDINCMACISRYPILETHRIPYKSLNNGSVAFYLKVDTDTLLLVGNHLESNKLNVEDRKVYEDMIKKPSEEKVKQSGRYLFSKLVKAVAIRAPQADSIAKYVKEHPVRYTIVCGDFNDSPLSYAYRVIGEGMQDAYTQKGFGPGFSYNRNGLYFRIDHLFVSPALNVGFCKVDNSIKASDHYPLWCLLERE